MQEYEITYITDSGLAEDKRGELDAAIDAVIAGVEGTISHNTPSANRRLAYPIRKQRMSFARTLQTTIDQAKIETVREDMRKKEGVMRLTIVQTPRREQVSSNLFEDTTKATVEPKKAAPAADTKPAKKLTDADVEERIEDALYEESK